MSVKNYKMMLGDLGRLASNENQKSLYTLLRGETLHQFDTLCYQVGITTIAYLNRVIMGLGMYFFCQCVVQNNRVMRCRMRKPHDLKFRRYAARLIDLDEDLSSFTESKVSDNVVETDLGEILLNSTPNGWSKQAYVQGFIVKL